jgi:hypothetical protein
MESSKDGIVLSFDVGIKNLAVAALLYVPGSQTAQLVFWEVHTLADSARNVPCAFVLCDRLFEVLDGFMDKLSAVGLRHTTVLIEYQPSRGIMKAVEAWIFSYLVDVHRRFGAVHVVKTISAKHKLTCHPQHVVRSAWEGLKPGYRSNKKVSVRIAHTYVQDDAPLQTTLASSVKKDDLADALMQAVTWLRLSKVCPNIGNITSCPSSGHANGFHQKIAADTTTAESLPGTSSSEIGKSPCGTAGCAH